MAQPTLVDLGFGNQQTCFSESVEDIGAKSVLLLSWYLEYRFQNHIETNNGFFNIEIGIE